ncbi:hypothetical protein COCNU_09G008940 [Cocos nucifera]|uniref:Uncharacterized protein n=1 Tax=Cocos nucifera TaxID=13894 RepID=A0A8K0IL34_COCNU|nr:hypothetical protein COCNU_09G008940 [Cocos nucifera]
MGRDVGEKVGISLPSLSTARPPAPSFTSLPLWQWMIRRWDASKCLVFYFSSTASKKKSQRQKEGIFKSEGLSYRFDRHFIGVVQQRPDIVAVGKGIQNPAVIFVCTLVW